MMDGDEPVQVNDALQLNRGEKRSYDEMPDGDDEPVQIGRGQDDERPFNIESVTQVNIKKIRTTGMNYRVRFTNAFADLEISSLHDRLHEVFQQILDETIGGVPPLDQLRVILHSTQLEYPITFPFMAPHRLTTERILAEFQRVIQSNQEFRLSDTVDVKVIHVSMPSGGKGSKRSEVNLEKHLEKKRSIVRIQNDDDLCMARALVVAKVQEYSGPSQADANAFGTRTPPKCRRASWSVRTQASQTVSSVPGRLSNQYRVQRTRQ